MAVETLVTLKIGTGWIGVTVVSEAEVVLSFKGYAPVLKVEVIQSGLIKQLFIGSKSLATSLEGMRQKNGGRFIGLKFRLKKESDEKMSPYVLEALN